MDEFLIRCSSLGKIIGKSDTELTETAKLTLRAKAKYELFGFRDFEGSKYTEKGLILEEDAIKLSGLTRGRVYKKNQERKENGFLTGECDIFDEKRNVIIDTKCSWDIGTHPFFKDEAEAKAKKAGYDWQMQGYMWLWGAEKAEIDFCLFPTPQELLGRYDSPEKNIELVQNIPKKMCITTVEILRDEAAIEKIKKCHELAKAYYQNLLREYNVEF